MTVQVLSKQAAREFAKWLGPKFGRIFYRKMVEIINATNDALAPVGTGSEDNLASYTATGIFQDSGLSAADISNTEFQYLDGLTSSIQDQLDGKAPTANGVTNGNSHDHSGGDGAQIDHGELAGLSDDDHSQYHTDARGDARYAIESNIILMQEFAR